MHRNPYWLGFLIVAILCALSYTGHTLFKVYQYQRLTRRIPVQQLEWNVKHAGTDAYVPVATYQLNVRGTIYEGRTEWDESYLNEWAAQEAINRLTQHPLTAWFDPNSPAHSSLQKNFPLKESLSAITLWFLLVYFIGLGQYVTRYKQ